MQEKTFKQLLMSSNYYTLNKQVVKTLGIEPAFLLTILIEASDGLADDEGWFYQTIETLEDLTGLSRHKQNKIIQDLIEASILIQENRGTPCRRFFKISFQEIENLVFKKTETSLLKIDKLDCKKLTNYSVKKSQTSLLKIDNNKEHNINNINKELNHKEEKAPDDLKKIKEWFKKNEIDFSKKHEDKIIELLKNNSIDYILNFFQEQIDILKNKKDIKNIAAVFSAHLFKGTCEVNLQAIEQKELEQEKSKNEQRKEYQKNDKAMEVFKSLPTEQQLKIEDEIIEEFKNPALREIKKNTEVVFYLMISQKIKEKITELGLLSA
ncbi:hypothetical protein [Fusobacterium pseudoperiodonticum]|uniref:Replication protein n=1 Tax=Fusobacterium pseudoperiodonticum TaxID=2663009 RepID=A0AAD0F1J0_9FUSO|nr:hypothetical protein [Fusobacterium pseudoperiodonticum]ATV35914.1 hypothetical protein CTM64_07655 [Fusobacterium pseudoperiodonticum]ATV61192.1 hypothetical protein CTM74_04720 [Fusobacterium pseudoperiodonticum]